MVRYIKDENGNTLAYCEYEDLVKAGMSKAVLKNSLNYYRKGKSKSYANILDPDYTGRGTKRLIEIESISNVSVKKRVKDLLGVASEAVREAIQITSEHNPNGLMETASKAVGNIIEMSLPYVHSELRKLLPDAQDIELYRAEGANLMLASQYAHSLKVLKWIRKQWQAVQNARNVDRVAFCSIMAEAILQPPPMELKFTTRLAGMVNVIEQVIENSTNLHELVKTGKIGNENAKKVDEALEKWVLAQYANGNKPKISHIYNVYSGICEKKGEKPVSYTTLYNICKNYEQVAQVERAGMKQFKLQTTVTVNRELPMHTNAVWEIDGTPANINVWDAKAGKVRQFLYKAYVIDVATRRIVGVSYSKSESATLYIDALKDAVRYTSHLPQIVHTDHFGGHKIVNEWLTAVGSKLHLVSVGNARAKIVEGVLGHFASSIERYLVGFNGLNMTAKGSDAHVSGEWIAQGYEAACTFEQAGEWMKSEGREWHNNKILKQLNRKPCGKSPNQLAMELESATEPLTKDIQLMIAGQEHTVKMTVDGLMIHKDYTPYIYFPDAIKNSLDAIAKFLNRNLGKRLKLYTYEAGEPALVTYLDGKATEFGLWQIKDTVPYTPDLMVSGDGAKLQALLGIGKKQTEQAKASVKSAKESSDFAPAEDKSARYGYDMRLNKVEFAQAEVNAKSDRVKQSNKPMKLKKVDNGYVCVDTGEMLAMHPTSGLPLLPKGSLYEII